MTQWKITSEDDIDREKKTVEYLTFKKDSMTIRAKHFMTAATAIVNSDTRPEITVGENGYDFVSLFSIPNTTVDSVEPIKPYDYRIEFDIENESDLNTWRNFLKDEIGALTLDKVNLLESEGWTKTYSLITKSQLTIEEVV